MTRLSYETMKQATLNAAIGPADRNRLFKAVKSAMDGNTVELRKHLNNNRTKALYNTYRDLPLADHLQERLIEGHDLNRQLAERLLGIEELDHRAFLTAAAQDLPDHRTTIEDAVRCEDLLAVVEAIFFWLCASKGKTIEAAVVDLPVDLGALGTARESFGRSGIYQGSTAAARHSRFREQLNTSSNVDLARSVLLLHQKVSEERKRAPWVWEDQGVLLSDVEAEHPSDSELQVGLAWRNDYYLGPLQGIANQLAEARG